MTTGATVTRTPGPVTVDLGREREVDRVRLAEDIRHGQQVEAFVVEVFTGGRWTRVAGSGTVGASRILRLTSPVRARRWRVRVTRARAEVPIAEFGLYRSAVG
ncbi:discoidin domain-containing protein [Streptomyces sp. SID12501]|uniref:discoidin domain-containing protein n=1 Tax=Streptomyces sp. SID12501 TaxID=2706042 RepID=UPI0031BA2142